MSGPEVAITRCDSAGLRILLGLALLMGTWLSLSPAPLPLPEVALADKCAHLVAFVLLAFLIDGSWPERGFDLPKWGSLLGYGVLIELLQTQVPNRVLSLGDIFADAAGLLLYGLVLLHGLRATRIR